MVDQKIVKTEKELKDLKKKGWFLDKAIEVVNTEYVMVKLQKTVKTEETSL